MELSDDRAALDCAAHGPKSDKAKQKAELSLVATGILKAEPYDDDRTTEMYGPNQSSLGGFMSVGGQTRLICFAGYIL